MDDRALTLKILQDIMNLCKSYGVELGNANDHSPLQLVYQSASFLYCHLLVQKKSIQIIGPPEPNGLEHSQRLD